jgi:hypothetical protein
LDLPPFPVVPVAVALGVDTVFIASDGITVAPLGAIDGYADCVGNATPLNASTMNVTDSFMNGSDGRPYDKCGSKVVPFPQIFSNQHSETQKEWDAPDRLWRSSPTAATAAPAPAAAWGG